MQPSKQQFSLCLETPRENSRRPKTKGGNVYLVQSTYMEVDAIIGGGEVLRKPRGISKGWWW
jgi:hypothetical protein